MQAMLCPDPEGVGPKLGGWDLEVVDGYFSEA